MIPLMKQAFLREHETKQLLARFIIEAPRLSMDVQCLEFEKAFAGYQERQTAILFNSGGSANLALLQALKNLGRLGEGQRIGFSAVTWSTNVMPILQLGMVPVAVDCDPTTLNVTSQTLEERMDTTRIDVLFLTNALGFTGDLARIRQLCEEREVLLLEDNCESLGTTLPEGRSGNFGMAATFSFFVAHHMSTIEGGMVCTDDLELAEMLKIVRANGWDRNLTSAEQMKWRRRFGITSEFDAKYSFYDLGFNLRPTEITGFLGLQQLQLLEENLQARWRHFERLESVASRNPDLAQPRRDHISFLSSFAFPVICRSPELRMAYLTQFAGAGVEIRPMIAGNIQRQPFYQKYVQEIFPTPGADFLHDCGFYFGNYPDLTQMDLETLSSCLTPR